MSRAAGTLGNAWGQWKPSASQSCTNCPQCGVLHAPGIADLKIWGECPDHGSSQISINGLRFGSAQNEGDNLIDREMMCGDLPVGITDLWVNLKKPGIMSFTMKVHCFNCRKKADTVVLMNKTGVQCQTIASHTCCDRPVLEYVELSARLFAYGDRTLMPLHDITFAPPRGLSGGAYASQPGILQVFPMNNKWVAVQGPAHDFYARIQADVQNRIARATNLQGRQLDQVEVHVVDEDQMSFATLRSADVTQCPRCQEMIERDGGCDHMSCTKCHHHFNFRKALF